MYCIFFFISHHPAFLHTSSLAPNLLFDAFFANTELLLLPTWWPVVLQHLNDFTLCLIIKYISSYHKIQPSLSTPPSSCSLPLSCFSFHPSLLDVIPVACVVEIHLHSMPATHVISPRRSVGLHTVNETFAFNQMYLEWLQVLILSLLHLTNSCAHLSSFLICS